MPYEFPPALLERLSHLIEGGSLPGIPYPSLTLALDLEGYDTSDPALVASAVKQARQIMRDRRFLNSAMGRFTTAMMTNREIGVRLGGLPKSSVQALACGRLPERYTNAQREAFRKLIAETVEACRESLDLLG